MSSTAARSVTLLAKPPTAEQCLAAQGWSGDRLMREARKIANDYIAQNVPYMGDRREDLVSFLTLKALESVGRFDPNHAITSYGSNGGSHFGSWICDLMEKRCIDWYRSKAEGNGDRRYGNDNRIVLTDMGDDPDPDVDFGGLVSEKRVARWERAAKMAGMSTRDWVLVILDKAAAQAERGERGATA